ncbi:MAG: cob(I)yrinic acid a,c-diamide adenosyltransferase [Crenarchaeota archaeon]|nr:cob(I)yrinic acid a,c-diamide adenosyltransferase [Thermoproteota archaeon]
MTGLVLVLYGDGKGKTTSAIGLTVRAVGHNMRVLFVQFIKRDLNVGEYRILKTLPNVKHVALGPGLGASRDSIIERTHRGLEMIRKEKDDYDIIVLDEVGVATVKYEYPISDIISLIDDLRTRGKHVVVTGKYMPRELIDSADLVTEFKCLKHYYERVRGPVRGLDF